MVNRKRLHPRYSSLLILVAALAQSFGCSQSRQGIGEQLDDRRAVSEEKTGGQPERGCVVLIPGVVGQRSQLNSTCAKLREAGVDYDFEVIDWGTSPFQPLENLTDLQANVKRAEKIADRLTTLRRERPGQPLILVGKSGGAGLAIMSAEKLPEDVKLDRVILVAAAISQDYDLSRVRAHCKGEIVNFYSGADQVVCLGTLLFGTIDREMTVSAGYSGFVNEAGKLREEEKLVQIAWEPWWLLLGHYGGHMGYRGDGWVRQFLAVQIDPSLAEAAVSG